MFASLWQNFRNASVWDQAWREGYYGVPDPHQPPALFGQPDLPGAYSQSNVAFGSIWPGIVQAVQGRWHSTWERFAFSACFLRCLGLSQRRCADDLRSVQPEKNQAWGYSLLPQGYTFWAKNWWPDIVWLQVDPQNLLCAADETRCTRWRSRKTQQRRIFDVHQHRLTRISCRFAMRKSDLACALDSQGAAAAQAHDPFNQEALPCCRSMLQTQAMTLQFSPESSIEHAYEFLLWYADGCPKYVTLENILSTQPCYHFLLLAPRRRHLTEAFGNSLAPQKSRLFPTKLLFHDVFSQNIRNIFLKQVPIQKLSSPHCDEMEGREIRRSRRWASAQKYDKISPNLAPGWVTPSN